jgi:hypothetical protein
MIWYLALLCFDAEIRDLSYVSNVGKQLFVSFSYFCFSWKWNNNHFCFLPEYIIFVELIDLEY